MSIENDVIVRVPLLIRVKMCVARCGSSVAAQRGDSEGARAVLYDQRLMEDDVS